MSEIRGIVSYKIKRMTGKRAILLVALLLMLLCWTAFTCGTGYAATGTDLSGMAEEPGVNMAAAAEADPAGPVEDTDAVIAASAAADSSGLIEKIDSEPPAASGTKKGTSAKGATKVKKIKITGNLYFTPGKKSTLKAIVTPSNATNKKVTWTSGNTSIATVSSKGVVRGKAPGTVTITAKAKDGSGVKKSVKVVIFRFSSDMRMAGHRGMRTGQPGEQTVENTAAAFRVAGKYGLWGCDCDVWETKHTKKGNFKIVINHDATFLRIYGVNKKVEDMTASQISADPKLSAVCFFDEYLSICAEYGMTPVIEIKDPDMTDQGIRKLVDQIAKKVEWDDSEDAYIFSSYTDNLTRVRDYSLERYGFAPITMFEVGQSMKQMLDDLDYFVEQGLSGICTSKNLMSSRIDKFCRNNGLRICLWTWYDTVSDNTRAYQYLWKKNYNVDVLIIQDLLY